MNRICLTHLSHDSIGGIPGMILTAADVIKGAVSSAKAILDDQKTKPTDEDLPGLDLIGPVGTQKFMSSLRHFIRRDSFHVQIHEGDYTQPKNGGPKKRKKGGKNKGAFDLQSIVCQMHDFHRSEDSRKRQRVDTNLQQALSYIFTTPPIQGKFLVKRAMALGIRKGPLFGQLKNGKSVTFTTEDGTTRTVDSSEVVEPGSPGVSVAVLYYPTSECLGQLTSSEKLNEYKEKKKYQPVLELIVHMTTRDLFLGNGAKEWRNSFGDEVRHIFLATDVQSAESSSDEVDNLTPFHSAMIGAIARSEVCNSVYSVPKLPIKPRETIPMPQLERGNYTETDYTEARPLLEYTIVPRSKRGFGNVNASVMHWNLIRKHVLQILEQSGAKREAEAALSNHSTVLTSSKTKKGELIFTGTGSAVPCKHRNVSGIYLKLENGNSMLLDVGEGTVGQLMRARPGESFSEVLCGIKAVWISHPHADHHLGLLRLLSDRRQVTEDPLLLIAPTSMHSFLQEYQEVDATVQGSYTFVDCQDVSTRVLRHMWLPEKHDSHRQKMEHLNQDLGITKCTSVRVAHCRDAFAVILENTCFGRLVYSGDCRPSGALAYAALGADLLIHEATFANGMEAEATLKRHSTVGEALQVASDMKAKAVILTHFSQRYPKVPPVARKHNAPIVFAFDFLRVTPENLLVAADLTQAMRLLYSEETAEKDDIAEDAAKEAMNVPGLFAQKDVL
ncbi:MAG: hypothetical protein SGBAC_008036 [Bacillariaceae sp.]